MHFISSSVALLATFIASLAVAAPTVGNINIASRGLVLFPRDNICGVTPSNSTATTETNDAAAIDLVIDTDVAAGCLDFCKSTTECLSVEYGTFKSGGEDECLMFTEAASALAVPTDGQSLIAFDVGCPETYKLLL